MPILKQIINFANNPNIVKSTTTKNNQKSNNKQSLNNLPQKHKCKNASF